jgi:aminoglycoside phosphotransferase family enzyme
MTATADLAAKVAFLRRPEAHRDATGPVQAIETHMSWVFLTDTRAVKLKKPVRFRSLDYGTVEVRRRMCEEEVRVNGPLAPTVYLGVAALTATAGALAIEGPGEVVDWLVIMRRLSADRMLPGAIARGDVTAAQIAGVADALERFYAATDRAPWPGPEYRRRLRAAIVATAGELIERGQDPAVIRDLATFQLSSLAQLSSLIDARVREGRVVDAHGDLRPEHVCLEEPPVVFDRLEFDRELRLLDVASELSFFALECDRLGAPWIGAAVLRHHGSRTGDHPAADLLALYRTQHACVRAVLALRHLDDAPADQRERWRRKADDYTTMAAATARQA